MKTTIFAIAAAATLVSAQNFGGEPACAIPCLTSAIAAAGCALTDEACQCGTGMAAIQSDVTPCLLSACNNSDLGVAASVGLGLCSSYSASLASASATTTLSSTVTSTSTVVSSTSSPTSTSTVTASTTSVPATTSAPVTTSSKASSGASSASTSGPSQVSTAGAPMMVAGMGGLVGIVAGFVAAL